MRFGLVLNPQSPVDEDPSGLFEGLVEQTRAARDAGFALVTMGQHYLADYNQLQSVPLLSRLAAEAGSMAVGPGVILMPFHHPIEIAEQLTTLDTFVDGTIAGVGVGYRDVEFESFGVLKAERVGRLVESVELMNRLWTGSDVTYDGEFYSVDGVSINPRPDEKPPVWVAGNSDPAVERAARIGDAWFVNPHSTITEIRHQKARYDEMRRDRGASTSVPLIREAFVATSHDDAVSVARDHLESKYRRYVDWGQHEAMEDESELSSPFEELARDRFLLGTPAEVCEQVERYDHHLDLSHLVVRVHWPGMEHDSARECIRLFGDEVLPNV
jgi:alkanesulfonate monooxygenase SsuD/methylene tetrahydromethanopterin reductase-like flavin-dependent oxidoreductase (luciferase family)